MRTIKETNLMIAKVMGYTFYEETGHWYDDEGCFIGTELLFDSDWNWLMEAVEKMWEATQHRNLFYQDVEENVTLFSDEHPELIKQVYSLVVKYIEYRNQYM